MIDATGIVVAPAIVDLAARLREPGHEHEGMLESEMAAAAAPVASPASCARPTPTRARRARPGRDAQVPRPQTVALPALPAGR